MSSIERRQPLRKRVSGVVVFVLMKISFLQYTSGLVCLVIAADRYEIFLAGFLVLLHSYNRGGLEQLTGQIGMGDNCAVERQLNFSISWQTRFCEYNSRRGTHELQKIKTEIICPTNVSDLIQTKSSGFAIQTVETHGKNIQKKFSNWKHINIRSKSMLKVSNWK